MLASLRLRVWELSRRNRQGDLPVPAFWPRRLGPWFWPLLLALAGAVAAALLVLALNALPAPLGEVTQNELAQNDLTQNEASPVREGPLQEPAGSAAGAAAAELAPPPPLDRSVPPGSADTTPPVPGPDPLLALLQPADPRRLVRSVREWAAFACLRLELTADFQTLASGERQRQAEDWLLRALELGYERLELVDGSGRLLGRTARVGSGMILLDAPGAVDVA
ncbi:MAG: hypothetical protein WBN89_00525 [Prochlorococcaceae cyanobacterium]